MRDGELPTFRYLVALGCVAAVGLGLLIWLVPVSAEEMTPAQTTLHGAADWMLKGSIGAMLGFGGARMARDSRSGEQ